MRVLFPFIYHIIREVEFRPSINKSYLGAAMDTIEYVDNFEETEDDKRLVKRRRANRVWCLKQTFETPEAAEEAVQEQNLWKKCSSTNTPAGNRITFRCTAGKYRDDECPAGLYLLYHASSAKVSLYETDCEHANHNREPTRGLSHEMKNFINQKYDEGITKPNSILVLIKKKGWIEPTKSQLASYLKKIRFEKDSPPTVSAREIRNCCEERKRVPEELDIPFVLAYNVDAQSVNVEEQDLKIVVSTRRLLSMAKTSPLVQLDTTHKVTWQGYSVLIVGTTDTNEKFHPIALTIMKSETTQDYAFLFRSLEEFDSEYKPTLLLADANDAITAGFTTVFGLPEVRLTCYSSLMRDIEKLLKSFIERDKRDHLKADIQVLQQCQNRDTFVKASQLLIEKWEKSKDQQIESFLNYLSKQCFVKYPNWFEGAALGYPSTNKELEATNLWIKRSHLLRERLPVDQFFDGIVNVLENWSRQRDSYSFADAPTKTLPFWTEAYQWAVENRTVLQQPHNEEGCTQYFVGSSTFKGPLTKDLLLQFQNMEGVWDTFESFKEHRYGIWRIIVNAERLNESNCSCPTFLKSRGCKHCQGMLIRLKLVSVPAEAKNVPLIQKRKRGRPSKTNQVFMTQ